MNFPPPPSKDSKLFKAFFPPTLKHNLFELYYLLAVSLNKEKRKKQSKKQSKMKIAFYASANCVTDRVVESAGENTSLRAPHNCVFQLRRLVL